MVRGEPEQGLELLAEARERFEALAEPDAFGTAITLMSTAFTRAGSVTTRWQSIWAGKRPRSAGSTATVCQRACL